MKKTTFLNPQFHRFKEMDKDSSGDLTSTELAKTLEILGTPLPKEEVEACIKRYDKNGEKFDITEKY
jgi:Ca2+-binding EF-hand superfamily protein